MTQPLKSAETLASVLLVIRVPACRTYLDSLRMVLLVLAIPA